MPSTNTTFVPAVVAGVVAVALTLRRYATLVLLELPVDVTPQLVTRLTVGARFAAFVLVYALLLGVAYRVGSRHPEAEDATLVGATFAVATTVALAISVGVLVLTDAGDGSLPFTLAAVTGASVATGVQLAVVAFAGVAAGRR